MIDSNMTSFLNLHRTRGAVVARLSGWAFKCVLALALLWPAAAMAQDEDVKYDARLDGYENKVHLDSDSTALTWLLLVALAMVAMGVMFKNAKRTHLD